MDPFLFNTINTTFSEEFFNHADNDDFILFNTTFSELDIEEFLNNADNDDCNTLAGAGSDLAFPYINPDNLIRFSRGGGIMTGYPVWSQSSLCAESPTSDTNPKGGNTNVVGATSDYEQSDDDDTEIEAGQCEQSNDQMDVKRHKRMASNRESAKRSRKKKQAHLTDLDQQVKLLRVEYSDLSKQLTNANHQFKDASTNNVVLKAHVEALRAKVKLAEDMLARGSLTSSLSHLLQNHLTTPHMFNCQNMSRMGNVSPTITVSGDDLGPHAGLPVPGKHMMVGLGTSPGVFTGNVKNGINSDGGSCVSNIWLG
ncbi:hypothetical protein L1987_26255 [Smallanthus sonchifolius]|uniref:Uncharacterized protein n=1 Tax=Smallanthus sonchifolius TaxID=185202 RepID=A0ACB9I9Z8_9ASTR|nr:hypothetical protein L1987_26255 [Smallanthus sonchifolius]